MFGWRSLWDNAKRSGKHLALLLLVAFTIWLPRWFDLDRFVATDEVAWLPRAANFYYALGQRDFAATNINSSPGVVTMWINTLAFLLEFPQYRGYGQGYVDKHTVLERFLNAHGVSPHEILIRGRQCMVLLNVGVLTIAWFLARGLVGDWPAALGFFLLAFEPWHVGVTRLAHLDGPMASFMLLSLVAFARYLYQKQNLAMLALSALAAALALLSKLPAAILLPTLALLWAVKVQSQWKESAVVSWKSHYWAQFVKPGLFWIAIFYGTFTIFYPAMWVDPLGPLSRMTNASFRLVGQYTEPSAVNLGLDAEVGEEDHDSVFEEAWSSVTKRPLEYYLRYPQKYLWHASPVVLLGLLVALIALVKRFPPFDRSEGRSFVLALLVFALLYTVLMTIPPKSSLKYYLPVYSVLTLLGGMGWYSWIRYIAKHLQKRHSAFVLVLGLLALIFAQIFQAWQVHPYYITYVNPWLARDPQVRVNIPMGSGEGLDQAAAYLNQKAGAERLRVLSWYGIGPFSYYFLGKTIKITPGTRLDKASVWPFLEQADYLVVYSNQWYRRLPAALFDTLEGIEPEKRIYLNGIEYVRIYATKEILERK